METGISFQELMHYTEAATRRWQGRQHGDKQDWPRNFILTDALE